MCDVRIVECPVMDCDGGMIESQPYGVNYNDGSPLTHIERCGCCNGEGWIIAEVQPCTELDLDELDEAGALERPGLIIP